MDSIINFTADVKNCALVIPHIQFIMQKDEKVEIIYNALASEPSFVLNFPSTTEAESRYTWIRSKIEAYYQAMMPQKK